MRLMMYTYTIYHVLAKSFIIADTLSKAPVKDPTLEADSKLMESTNIYVNYIMENLPASAP